ncbi:F-box and WD repeat domain containing 5 S homeolog [Xenopus laevis]|uniref:F-box and WD repeat domain containing 5 S homeolog n=1 Tax=Xenopus laevis TaxID=8355 RepID=Q6DD10_XENLA|nr:F-box and WD repeat domain containing 5 S homeolog [Xenopus laevis]AAH77820.1 MGC80471 protein [Xenopus laevis]
MERIGPSLLPDTILYQIFQSLGPLDLLSAGLVCRRWYNVSRDDFLWKDLFYRHYRVQRHILRCPGAESWYEEFQRVSDTVPCVEVQRLREHGDQVLHISFSHSGDRFASCSKDCTIKDVESENVNVVKRLFKIQNLNASTIRMVMVASSPDLLVEVAENSEESAKSPPPPQAEEEEEGDRGEGEVEEDGETDMAEDIEEEFQIFRDNGEEGLPRPILSENQFETKVAQLYARYRTKSNDGGPKTTEGNQDKKYLIFTTGYLTYAPHQIGESPASMAAAVPSPGQ